MSLEDVFLELTGEASQESDVVGIEEQYDEELKTEEGEEITQEQEAQNDESNI